MIDRRILPRLVVFYIFGMVIATLFDYEITAYLTQGDGWAMALEIAGEPPALLFTAFNLALVGVWCFREQKGVRFVLCAVGAAVAAFYAIGRTVSYLSGSWMPAFTVPAGMILAAVLLIVLSRFPVSFIQRYVRTAVACVGAALTVLVVVSFLKQLWGRVRFRQLEADASLSFTDWYIINGFGNTSHVSFPSGHTANAAVLMMLSLYFPRQKRWLQPVLCAYIILMAVSRLAAGAHYLSDILTGCAITIFVCELWARKMGVSIESETTGDGQTDVICSED